MEPRPRAYLFLTLVAIIWGIAGPVIKFTLQGLPPPVFLSYRLTISAIVALVFFLIKGVRFPRTKKAHFFILLYGLSGVTLGLSFLFWGMTKATALDLTLLGILAPFVVILGGAYFFHDHVTKREKIGVLIILAGVALNSLYPIFTNGKVEFTGNVLLFLFLIFDAGSALIAKEAVKEEISPSTLSSFAFIIGFLTIVPFTLLTVGFQGTVLAISSLELKYHLGVWYMAILSGSLAYLLYLKGYKTIEVSEAVLFNYLQPVFAIPLAIVWLKEKPTAAFLIGAMVITAGVIIAEFKRRKPIPDSQLIC